MEEKVNRRLKDRNGIDRDFLVYATNDPFPTLLLSLSSPSIPLHLHQKRYSLLWNPPSLLSLFLRFFSRFHLPFRPPLEENLELQGIAMTK